MKTTAVEIRQLRIMVRTHTEISQAVCALCGQPNVAVKTGTGLYDGAVHLGDICKLCIRGGKRGAAVRTRAHCAELRNLAVQGRNGHQNGAEENYSSWLSDYGDFLEDLAGRVEEMSEWIPRPE
jgi:hypothetical protein